LAHATHKTSDDLIPVRFRIGALQIASDRGELVACRTHRDSRLQSSLDHQRTDAPIRQRIDGSGIHHA